MYQACLAGDKELVLTLIKNGNTAWNCGLDGACIGGYKDLALLMIEKGASKLNLPLTYACFAGHKDLALLMIEKGASDLNLSLIYACFAGHKDLALLMIEKGADINNCTISLTEFDIEYLLDKKVKDFGKFNELVKLCKEKRKLADQVLKELNLRDVNSIIYTY